MTRTRLPGYNFSSGEPATIINNLTESGDVTEWALVAGKLAVQITGTASAVTAVVERSTFDPGETANTVVVDNEPITGNPSTGIFPVVYEEPGAAWWRVRLTALTGGMVNVSISGKAADL